LQADELPDLPAFLERAAAIVAPYFDIDRFMAAATPMAGAVDATGSTIPPLGQRIAVANDVAFAFAYSFQLEAWRRRGAEFVSFSPLNDEAPNAEADAVFLPGGYPELHAGRLADNLQFQRGLKAAASRNAAIYGECGGYMVLGESLIDESGVRHPMAGLLPV